MKKVMILAFAGMAVYGSATGMVSLNEAEKMANDGKAVIIKLPSAAVLAKINEDEANATAKAAISAAVKEEPTVAVESKPAQPILQKEKEQPKPLIAKAVEKPVVKKAVQGVDIAMPTTLSSLLLRLSKVTGETYFCDDDLNVPPSKVKITDIAHLDRYLRQVSDLGIRIVKESDDASIPKVLKVVRAEAVK